MPVDTEAAWPDREERDGAPSTDGPRDVSPAVFPGPTGWRIDATPPPILTPIVGRERELATLTGRLVERGDRLLTLTGPGGVGKTRLAIAVLDEVRTAFADGVAYVDLTATHEPARVAATIGEALALPESGRRSPLAILRSLLRERRLLLVLDNFEHVVAAAPLILDLLGACPRLAVLVTSRTPLRLRGEQVVPVEPLGLPPADGGSAVERLHSSAAGCLFLERAQAIDPRLDPDEAAAAAIGEICRALDGLPLAIELAAARCGAIQPATLLARLGRRLPLLTGGARDLPARQRTMRDAIAWSYDLLGPDEQALFRRLAVFVGDCTLEAAEAVSRGVDGYPLAGRGRADNRPLPDSSPSRLLDVAVLDRIGALVESSLLRREVEPGGTARYGMLETIREFGLEQLEASGETEATRTAHAAYFLALAERWPFLPFTPVDQAVTDRVVAERANLDGALAWLEASGQDSAATRLVAALCFFWAIQGDLLAGRARLERVLARRQPLPAGLRTRLLLALGVIAMHLGDTPGAEALAEEALALARAAGDVRACPAALILLGIAANEAGAIARAVSYLEEARVLAGAVPDAGMAAAMSGAALAHLGVAAHEQGDLATAWALHERALIDYQVAGSRRGVMCSYVDLGDVARDQGAIDLAVDWYRKALRLAWELGDRRVITETLESLAGGAVVRGRVVRAVHLFSAAARLREALGLTLLTSYDRAARDQRLAAARALLGEPAVAREWAAGWELPLEQAVEVALDPSLTAEAAAPEAVAAGAAVRNDLTPREREILALLAARRTDREIAEALSISPKTVGRHVSAILAKLNVPSRRAAGQVALRDGLV